MRTLSSPTLWSLSLISVAVSLLFGIVQAAPVAAEAQITLSPTAHRLTIEPNKTYNGTVTIVNSSESPMKVRMYAAPYHVTDELYNPVFSQETARTQISRWIQIDQQNLTLAANQQATIGFNITTPSSIPAGGQYAAIFAETDETSAGTIMRKKRVGMLVYAKTRGDTVEKGSAAITKLPFFQIGSEIVFESRLRNNGNTDLTGKISVHAKPVFGDAAFSQTQEKVVLPDTTRRVATQWNKLPAFGLVNVTQRIDLAGKTTVSKQWLLLSSPVWLLGILAIVVALIIGGIYAYKRSHQRVSMRRSRR